MLVKGPINTSFVSSTIYRTTAAASETAPSHEYRKNLIPPDFVVGGIHAEKQWGWFP
jgi:hypothetical protein